MAGYNTAVNTLQQIHNHVGYLCTPYYYGRIQHCSQYSTADSQPRGLFMHTLLLWQDTTLQSILYSRFTTTWVIYAHPITMAGYNTEVNTLQQIHNHVGYYTTFTTDNLLWLRCTKTWLLTDNQ